MSSGEVWSCACVQPHMQCMSFFVAFKSTVRVHTVSCMALHGLCTVELSLPFVLDFGAGNICNILIATLMVCMLAILFGLHPLSRL